MEDSKVKSLAKAMRVLECFNARTPELGVTQISKMLGIGKSSVSNIVSTFEQMGYLEKDPESSRYRLGLKLLEYSYLINERLGYQRLFYDIMQDVSGQFNVITYFAIYRDRRVFYMCNTYPPGGAYNYPYRTIIGEHAPMYCTSLGKAMLAFLPADEVERILELERVPYTETTLTKEDDLRREIAQVRQQGFSLDREEHEYGVRCVGVPVFRGDNELFGAFSMSSPNLVLSEENAQACAGAMKQAALAMKERISRI